MKDKHIMVDMQGALMWITRTLGDNQQTHVGAVHMENEHGFQASQAIVSEGNAE